MNKSASPSTTESGAACKRCRLKKLKCDSCPLKCKNCTCSNSSCILVGSVTKREYERSYVDKLREEIRYYEELVRQRASSSQPRSQEKEGFMGLDALDTEQLHPSQSQLHRNKVGIGLGTLEPKQQNSSSPKFPIQITDPGFSSYQGDGSIANIAQLVAAAVASKTRVTSIIYFGNEMAREQDQLKRDHHVFLYPSSTTAHNMFDSSLTGPHVLHLFLQRSEITRNFQSLSADSPFTGKFLFRFYTVCAIGALYLNRTGAHATPAIDHYMAAMSHEEEALRAKELALAQNILLLTVFSGQ
ncbi:hypothetical protein BDW74DRAFT_179022 [Aspergillus multicolor]|uniref:Zn(II)2Cys6 transcription factor domain-containing protein n=1 Tax=Aspergillus multicolor TaxID=41759 RepID=UPI003CCCCA62